MGQRNTSMPAKKANQFGVTLKESANNSDIFGLVPSVLRFSFAYLNERALMTDGIYRIRGNTNHIEALRTLIEAGDSKLLDSQNTNEDLSPHDITGLEPFIPPLFMKDVAIPISLEACRSIAQQLDPSTRETCKLLINHIILCLEESKFNHSTRDLILGSLFQHDRSSIVISAFIEHFESIFDETESLPRESMDEKPVEPLRIISRPISQRDPSTPMTRSRQKSLEINMFRKKSDPNVPTLRNRNSTGGETQGEPYIDTFGDTVKEESAGWSDGEEMPEGENTPVQFKFSSDSHTDSTSELGTSLDAIRNRFLSESFLEKVKFSGMIDRDVDTESGYSTSCENTPRMTPRSSIYSERSPRPSPLVSPRGDESSGQQELMFAKQRHSVSNPKSTPTWGSGDPEDERRRSRDISLKVPSPFEIESRKALDKEELYRVENTIGMLEKLGEDEDKGPIRIHSPRILRSFNEKRISGGFSEREWRRREQEKEMNIQDKVFSIVERIKPTKPSETEGMNRKNSLTLLKTAKVIESDPTTQIDQTQVQQKKSSEFDKYLKSEYHEKFEPTTGQTSPKIHVLKVSENVSLQKVSDVKSPSLMSPKIKLIFDTTETGTTLKLNLPDKKFESKGEYKQEFKPPVLNIKIPQNPQSPTPEGGERKFIPPTIKIGVPNLTIKKDPEHNLANQPAIRLNVPKISISPKVEEK